MIAVGSAVACVADRNCSIQRTTSALRAAPSRICSVPSSKGHAPGCIGSHAAAGRTPKSRQCLAACKADWRTQRFTWSAGRLTSFCSPA